MNPPSRPLKPAWAVAFKRRREEQVGSQEELAIRADVSQSLISQIERGVQNPTGVSVERFRRLLEALNWSAKEFQEETGLMGGVSFPPADRPPDRPNLGPSPLAPRELRLDLPPELEEMIERHSAEYPELLLPYVQQTLAAPRNHGGAEVGPQTVNEWFAFFMQLQRWIVPESERH